jgi:hypothetical protein
MCGMHDRSYAADIRLIYTLDVLGVVKEVDDLSEINSVKTNKTVGGLFTINTWRQMAYLRIP